MIDSNDIARLAPFFAERDPGETALDPNSLGDPQDFGPLATHVALLQRGMPAGDVFKLLPAATQKAIARTDLDRKPDSHPLVEDMPELPSAAQLTPSQEREAEEAGRWIAGYVDFASQASPLTPRAFHVAAGLFAGSLAIARRLHLPVSTTKIYPNLYILFVGHSTLPRKTTAMGVLRGLLRAAEMRPFLLADRQTPEGLITDLGYSVQPTFDSMTSTDQDLWLQERSLAAQRGWLLEEASQLLDSFNRDYSAGLLPLVLDLYDCPDEGARRNTVSRGNERVREPYLSIFGAATYVALQAHLAEQVHWHNGLWPRFALVPDDTTGVWKFWPPPLAFPSALVDPLRYLARGLLTLPEVSLVTRPSSGHDANERPCREVVLDSDLVSHGVLIEPQAWTHWEAYARAMGYDLIKYRPIGLPEQFDASYGRLGTMLIKVAMILAAFDTAELPVTVCDRHVYRAQQIVEGWRASLHHVLGRSQTTQENNLETRIVAKLADLGEGWTTRRDLQRSLHVGLPRLQPALDALVAAGAIEAASDDDTRSTNDRYRCRVVR
ncbi:MAG: DUF3987 domain-containing protein [Anaerolineae bacterium]